MFFLGLLIRTCFGCGVLVRTGMWLLPMSGNGFQLMPVARHGDTNVRSMAESVSFALSGTLVGASLLMMIPFMSGNASSSALPLLLLHESNHAVLRALQSDVGSACLVARPCGSRDQVAVGRLVVRAIRRINSSLGVRSVTECGAFLYRIKKLAHWCDIGRLRPPYVRALKAYRTIY
jgi:hypothetical protein